MGFLKDAKDAADAAKDAQKAVAEAHAHVGLQYRVDSVREKLIGDHIAGGKLAALLNQRAGEGWTLKQIVPAEVEGRIGGGTSGLIVVFERPAP